MKKILITIPVYNEDKILKQNITILNTFLKNKTIFPYDYIIEIADNRSKDNTKKIGMALERKFKNVKYTYIDQQGKGRAIKYSWNNASKDVDVLSFMDSDLATDISYFPKLISAITKENYDLAIGSRNNKRSIVKRSAFRQFVTWGYLTIQKILFNVHFEDTQCGFKAIKKEKYLILKNQFNKKKFKFDKTDMFFDTELLLIAEKVHNLKIKSVPVKWTAGKDTKVNVIKLTYFFLKYLIKTKKHIKKLKLRQK